MRGEEFHPRDLQVTCNLRESVYIYGIDKNQIRRFHNVPIREDFHFCRIDVSCNGVSVACILPADDYILQRQKLKRRKHGQI